MKGASAYSPRSAGIGNVYSRCKRPGNKSFFHASVTCMASMPRVNFSPEFRTVVVDKACTLLQSVRRTFLQKVELLPGLGVSRYGH